MAKLEKCSNCGAIKYEEELVDQLCPKCWADREDFYGGGEPPDAYQDMPEHDYEYGQDPDNLEMWTVQVENVGTVYSGTDENEARDIYNEYVEASHQGYGRASGEDVTLLQAGEIVDEYMGRFPHDFDVRIEFNTGNAAFDDDYEIYRILNIIADRMRPLQDDSGKITDINGNTVGKWSVE